MGKDSVRKELGKWFMDIAKYITTAVLLATVFGSMEKLWTVCVFATLTILLTMAVGLWLYSGNKGKER